MKLEAHRVLEDCRIALRMLDEEEAEDRWRILWVAAMTLIRSVGHVLLSEADKDPDLKERVSKLFKEHWESKKSHPIFWRFIKAERDSLLKEGIANIYSSDSFTLVVEELLGQRVTATQFSLDGNLFRPIEEGPWIGQDARDVYLEAIEWWEIQLTALEQA